MNVLQTAVLGVVEGLTEFLPVSSTGHLTIAEKALGLSIDDPGITAFTAVIQVGAIAAVILYFRSDLVRLAAAWLRGLASSDRRGQDFRLATYVIAGSLPIGLVGFAARDLVSGPLRNLWVVVAGLVGWSIVMVAAERIGRRSRPEADLTLRDALSMGAVQCVALVPGVSRSGATISAGLVRDLDRVAATRLSFFLAIPALLGAGAYEVLGEASAIGSSVGWGSVALGTAISFVVAYASIAWLLRLVSHRPITFFVGYRLALAGVVAILLATGVMGST